MAAGLSLSGQPLRIIFGKKVVITWRVFLLWQGLF
jgi:hypothetical protein